MFKRISITVVFVMLIASVLTACGGAPAPVTFSSLPVFTGATESTNEVATATLTTLTDAAKTDPNAKNVQAKAYDVPAGTTLDAVKAFYKAALEKDSWKEAQSSADGVAYVRGNQQMVFKYADGVGLFVMMVDTK